MNYRTDCRHYIGEKPCRFKCEGGCQNFEPFGTRILIIKLGAIGDVLRTTPLLRLLKEKYSQSHITWVVDDIGQPLLKNNPYIDRILTPNVHTLARLIVESFDLVLCLDKVDFATGLAMSVKAREKLGFSMTENGTLSVFNPEAEYALLLGLSDDEKFHRNQNTYQQIIFEALGEKYSREEYVLPIGEAEAAKADEFRTLYNLTSPVIGINTGAGNVFAGKAWRKENIAAFCDMAYEEFGVPLLLLGGPQETLRNQQILEMVKYPLIDTGTDNSLPHFSPLVNLCDVVVTGDTTCMHIAIAHQKRTVVLFGSTCPQEIDLYGRGEKVVAPVTCAPCYLKNCPINEICMDEIKPEQVLAAVQRQVAALKETAPILDENVHHDSHI
jgi:heptosyltransferase-2